MSQIYLQEIDLKELVWSSDYIYQVRKMKPFITERKIPVTKKLDYKHSVYHFQVMEVLAEKKNEWKPPELIEVVPAYLDTDYTIYKRYHLENVSKSPIYDSYKGTIELDGTGDEEMIIFIHLRSDGFYEFTVIGSYESVKKKKEILRYVTEKNKN